MRIVLISTPKSVGIDKANPIGSVIAWPLIALPTLLGILFINHHAMSVLAVVLFTFLYIVTYHILVHKAVRLRGLFV